MARDYGINTIGSVTRENDIFASTRTPKTMTALIAAGQNLKRGTLLSHDFDYDTNKSTYFMTGSTMTANSVDAVLAIDTDATDGDEPATIYLSGDFLKSKVIHGTEDGFEISRANYNSDNIIFKEEV